MHIQVYILKHTSIYTNLKDTSIYTNPYLHTYIQAGETDYRTYAEVPYIYLYIHTSAYIYVYIYKYILSYVHI